MDKLFWFGWLLKGAMQVSLLDRVIGAVECITALFVLAWIAAGLKD